MLQQIEAIKGYLETFWKHLRNDAQHTLDRFKEVEAVKVNEVGAWGMYWTKSWQMNAKRVV